ncbi:hypothetical protein OOZ15_01910 [Galbibacter sp. EGI 63066]|uniref:hypothetical protein n=1 Tax=Galbibacter sp. EGI 63066 TaxID=2993559 RepID=UPI0022498D2E|nr:hypothetical protein [Galbibacter sp. EGI 63066]MCX2678685.1 hypothetical protein [Galbibacter sp. EGI 63066]
MKKTIYSLVLIVSVFYSCSSSDDSDDGTTPTDPETPENTVKLSEDGTFGEILTDSEGMTLYFFSNDSKMTSTCEGECLSAWPVFYEEELTLDDGLDEADFGTITREDGEKQTTYKGWPLYYYVGDSSAGDTIGDGVGNVWYVAKPDYSLMYVNAQLVGNDGNNYVIDDNGDYVEGDGATLYITDALGNTLYAFTPDTNDTNNYTAEDFSNDAAWPIFHEDLGSIPSILNESDFNVISVHGERNQLTYKGWPLYYFGGDGQKGDNKGVSVPEPGIWPIVNTATGVAPAE